MLNPRSVASWFVVLSVGVLAGCGSGSGGEGGAGEDGTGASETTLAAAEDTVTSIAGEDEPSETTPPETAGPASADWSGPSFIDLAQTRMSELQAPIGQPYSAAAVGSVFAMPSNFPDMAGTITGVFNVWEVDIRDGEISQERVVGTDTVASEEDLKAHGADFIDNDAAPWKLASISDGGDNYGAVFTSQADPDPGLRLILRAFQDPDVGEPNFQWILELDPTEIVAPSWAASLPIPEGGQLGGFREGIGVVEDFGWLAEDGFLEITTTYPTEALPELEAFFGTDVLKQAGFTYEDTPFNNQSVRIDLSIEDWTGKVSVWEGSYGDTTYYGVTWTLVRPVGQRDGSS